MTTSRIRLAAVVLLSAFLIACSDDEAPAAQAPAPGGEPGPVAGTDINAADSAQLKGFITRSGEECAEIVSVRSLGDLSNEVEVLCSKASGLGKVSYVVDLMTEKARKAE